jgi:hypothetical protein
MFGNDSGSLRYVSQGVGFPNDVERGAEGLFHNGRMTAWIPR